MDRKTPRQRRIEARSEVLMRLLRRHRVATGQTIEQVAKKLGVTPGAVSNWETGTHGMTPKHLKKFARLLGISPIELSKMVEPDVPELELAAK